MVQRSAIEDDREMCVVWTEIVSSRCFINKINPNNVDEIGREPLGLTPLARDMTIMVLVVVVTMMIM